MRLLFLSFLVVLAGFGWLSDAKAHEVETTSHVAAATIFADRAIVTRIATVHIPAGAHIISVTDMPSGLDDQTLRVQGKSSTTVKIGTVEVKRVFLKDIASATERDKSAPIEAKTDEKSLLEGEIRALEARKDLITRIAQQAADKSDINGPKSDFTLEKWTQALNLVQNDIADTEKNLTNKRIALRKLNDEIGRLQAELNQVKTTEAKEQREAHITYEAAEDTDLELSLTYQTAGASWHPVYDARLDAGSGDLQLEQYGQVKQQTGEDWNDVDLTLSTAQPARGSEMPRLGEWWVRLYQEVRAQAYSLANSDVAMKSASRMQAAMAPGAPAPEGPLNELRADASDMNKQLDAVQSDAAVQSTEYSAEFHVPGHVPLKSVDDFSKLFIGKVGLKADLTSQISPRLAPQAYLFAKITNSETYPLIPGTVAKYRDGAFIGNSALGMLRSSETSNLSFGVDDRVKVSYQQIKQEQSNPTLIVVGDMTVERQYQTKVQNLHKNPITITVFEQYPVANDSNVDVKLLDDLTTSGFAKDPDNRQGIITWSSLYQPKEEKTFTLGFRVKYPKDRQIMGL